MTETLSLFGLWAGAGILIIGVIPWLFKKILSTFFTIRYAVYFNQKMVYDSITRKLDSGLTIADIINDTQKEITNAKSK
jgi:hypothetical protein